MLIRRKEWGNYSNSPTFFVRLDSTPCSHRATVKMNCSIVSATVSQRGFRSLQRWVIVIRTCFGTGWIYKKANSLPKRIPTEKSTTRYGSALPIRSSSNPAIKRTLMTNNSNRAYLAKMPDCWLRSLLKNDPQEPSSWLNSWKGNEWWIKSLINTSKGKDG